MKKEQRQIYYIIANFDNPVGYDGLCNYCLYAKWKGDCTDADMECHCGIEKIEENAYDVWGGGDCWAFRPAWSLEDCVDRLGLMLQGEIPDMSNCRRLGNSLVEVKK